MTYYALELEKIQNEKPEVIEYLKNDAFSVNRTGKLFSRVAVNMALEQTINVEAKNCLKGIMAFVNINSTVNRWQVTSSRKTQIKKTFLR